MYTASGRSVCFGFGMSSAFTSCGFDSLAGPADGLSSSNRARSANRTRDTLRRSSVGQLLASEQKDICCMGATSSKLGDSQAATKQQSRGTRTVRSIGVPNLHFI